MKAYEVIDRPEKWTIGLCARDQYGCGVRLPSAEAVRFCAVGALMQAYFPVWDDYEAARNKLEARVGRVSFWNDRANYAEVYRTLRELDL